MTPHALVPPRGEYLGPLVALGFCTLSVANQVLIGTHLVSAADGSSRDLIHAVIYWFAFLSVAVHLFLWATYAAIATVVARVLLHDDKADMYFREVFLAAGWAHVPLLAWVVAVLCGWLAAGAALESGDVPALLVVLAATRLAAYASAVVFMAVLLYRRRRTTRLAAAAVAGAPAVVLWLALALVNGVAGVFMGAS